MNLTFCFGVLWLTARVISGTEKDSIFGDTIRLKTVDKL